MNRRFLIGITFVFCCDFSSRGIDTMKVPAPHKEKQRKIIASFSSRLTERFQVGRLTSARILRQTAEVSKAINAGAVSIRPARLQRIASNQIESDKLETLVGISHVWP